MKLLENFSKSNSEFFTQLKAEDRPVIYFLNLNTNK